MGKILKFHKYVHGITQRKKEITNFSLTFLKRFCMFRCFLIINNRKPTSCISDRPMAADFFNSSGLKSSLLVSSISKLRCVLVPSLVQNDIKICSDKNLPVFLNWHSAFGTSIANGFFTNT